MWKAKILDDVFCGGEKLVLYKHMDSDSVSIMQSDGDTMKTYKSYEAIDTFTLKIPRGGAEAILNALLERGVKPREQSRVEGMLESTKAHLEDMRRIVFKGGK